MSAIRRILPVAVILTVAAGVVCWLRSRYGHSEPLTPVWVVVSSGDARDATASLMPDGRACLSLNTIGTADRTIKVVGLRSSKALTLEPTATIGARLDWNNQANGSYLSAGLVLSPTAVAGDPLEGSDWLKVEYVGIPPGKNGRLLVAVRKSGLERHLYTDGWPKNREGRKLGLLDVVITLQGGRFLVSENGVELYAADAPVLSFSTAYLYLRMSGHSNYPRREVFFDRVRAP